MNKLFSYLVVLSVGVFFTACGGSSAKIVIPSYTAPKEAAKIAKIETKDEFISDTAYLALWINPEVQNAQETNPQIANMLIESVKAKLTETNFIALDPLGGDDGVALNMSVSNYEYKDNGEKLSLSLEVTFTLERGAEEFLVKKYATRSNRQSKDKTKLPTQNELASQAVDKLVRYFISDISPLKTNQLREFKETPKGLEVVIPYAKSKNYKGAIKAMNRYKGEKDMNYYYNLAVLYEAEASVTENLKLLKRSEYNYEQAMALGGHKDPVVISAKTRFDKFYELLGKTKLQRDSNQALVNDRNSMLGSSDDEYE